MPRLAHENHQHHQPGHADHQGRGKEEVVADHRQQPAHQRRHRAADARHRVAQADVGRAILRRGEFQHAEHAGDDQHAVRCAVEQKDRVEPDRVLCGPGQRKAHRVHGHADHQRHLVSPAVRHQPGGQRAQRLPHQQGHGKEAHRGIRRRPLQDHCHGDEARAHASHAAQEARRQEIAEVHIVAHHMRDLGAAGWPLFPRRQRAHRLPRQRQEAPTQQNGHRRNQKVVGEVERIGEGLQQPTAADGADGAQPRAHKRGQPEEPAALRHRETGRDQVGPGWRHHARAQAMPGIADEKERQRQHRMLHRQQRGHGQQKDRHALGEKAQVDDDRLLARHAFGRAGGDELRQRPGRLRQHRQQRDPERVGRDLGHKERQQRRRRDKTQAEPEPGAVQQVDRKVPAVVLFRFGGDGRLVAFRHRLVGLQQPAQPAIAARRRR